VGKHPSTWELATIISRAEAARILSVDRTFDSRHFDFRGGPAPRRVEQRHLRTRVEDC
jgi:hypothetical protein